MTRSLSLFLSFFLFLSLSLSLSKLLKIIATEITALKN